MRKMKLRSYFPILQKNQLGTVTETQVTRSRASSYAVPPAPTSIEEASKKSPYVEGLSFSSIAIVETKASAPPDDQNSAIGTGTTTRNIGSSTIVDDELVEVDIHGQIMKTLEGLLNERFISIRPIIVEDTMIGYIQATVLCEREYVDEVAARVELIGIGSLIGSISVVSLDASRCAKPFRISEVSVAARDEVSRIAINNSNKDTKGSAAAALSAEQQAPPPVAVSKNHLSGKSVFMDVTGQLQIERVVEQIRASAVLNFDYLNLLLIASVIAGVGLATDSTVSIVAAMLVSPLMGPVLAMTFGSNILDYSLIQLGVVSELLSLAICVVMGFLIGLCVIAVGTDGSWPTEQMKIRGQVPGLLVGLAIAVPSGLGVALSVLGNNTSSLVGVAISLSLLPPAVNCGLALAYAAVGFQADRGAVLYGQYSTTNEYLNLGGISLALTAINIGAIFVAGCLMFRLKEVVPVPDKAAFWQKQASLFRERQLRQVQLSADELDAEHQALLDAVGQDISLRKKMTHWAQDDSLLGMTSGGALSGLLSTTTAPAKAKVRRRERYLEDVATDGDCNTNDLPAVNRKKIMKNKSDYRPITLLELFRDEFADVDDEDQHNEPAIRSPAQPRAAVENFFPVFDHQETPSRGKKAMSLNLRDPVPSGDIRRNVNAASVAQPNDSQLSELNIKQRLKADGKRKSVRKASLHYRPKTAENKLEY